MAIPDFQSIMLPLLKMAKDKKEHSLRSAVDYISDHFDLTEDERLVQIPSGTQKLIYNRTAWAKSHLLKAGLFESLRRGYFTITERGLDVLKENPDYINMVFLKQFEEYNKYIKPRQKEEQGTVPEDNGALSKQTPQEMLELGYQIINDNLADEILETIKSCPPDFFERLVIDLLLAMGYGGTFKDAGKAVGRSRDGGIDGIIKEDKLGLDAIYIQAKRWENTVPAKEIRDFIGSLEIKGAHKGVLITTSSFPKDSLDKIGKSTKKVVLVDGEQLAELMIDHNIGVSIEKNYTIKKIDSDYFSEE